MDPTSVLVEANRVVEAANVPDDLRPVAFSKAVDLVVGSVGTPATPLSRPSAPFLSKSEGEDEGEPALARVASRLKVDLDVIRDVYHEQDGELEIIVPSAKLDSGKKGGTRQLALLVAAGRQAAGMEEFTSIERVREVAEQYKKYDSPNFSRTVNEMEDDFTFRGDSRNREVRVSRPGWERASKLINELGGADS